MKKNQFSNFQKVWRRIGESPIFKLKNFSDQFLFLLFLFFGSLQKKVQKAHRLSVKTALKHHLG